MRFIIQLEEITKKQTTATQKHIMVIVNICQRNLLEKIPNHLIIRTRFFDKNFKYKDAATNIYSSMVEVNNLVKYIKVLINKDVSGVINVGETKNSDYNKLKKYIKNIKKTTRDSIQKNTKTFITKDSSMNLNKLKKFLK